MSTMLYLDTARLGQMSPTALKTHCDFVRLMAEDPSSLYTEQFLFEGANARPEIVKRFPNLAGWPGIEGLKQQLRNAFAANTEADTEVLLASRTTSLMQLSIRSLAATGRSHMLLTDLTWPPYLKWIKYYARRTGLGLSFLRLRKRIWKQGFSADDIATAVVAELNRTAADSLFLPSVTHTGIRLPLRSILQSLPDRRSDVHTIIDASQAYGHINTNDWAHLADFTFGGCHKWVRAYLPLSVGFSRQHGGRVVRKKMPRDALSQFCRTTGVGKAPMETVNLTPLFTAHGAVTELTPCYGKCRFASEAAEFYTPSKRCPTWPVLHLHHTLLSNIVLLQSASPSFRNLPNEQMRRLLAEHGISATTYGRGVIRISVPNTTFSGPERVAHQLAARLVSLDRAQTPGFADTPHGNGQTFGRSEPLGCLSPPKSETQNTTFDNCSVCAAIAVTIGDQFRSFWGRRSRLCDQP